MGRILTYEVVVCAQCVTIKIPIKSRQAQLCITGFLVVDIPDEEGQCYEGTVGKRTGV